MRTDRWTDGRKDIKTYMMKQMVALRSYYNLLMYSFNTCGHRCSMWDPLAKRHKPHLQAILSHFRGSIISLVDSLHSISNSVLMFLYRLGETMYLITMRSKRLVYCVTAL